MLGATGILDTEAAAKIIAGLKDVEKALESDPTPLAGDYEDIHSCVESLLRDLIGADAGRLHTARSRNDQVATDLRLWLRDEVDGVRGDVRQLQGTIVALARLHVDTILPGTTHLQHAQPVRLAHHLLTYFWMLDRDADRLQGLRKRVNLLPLGAGALAGTPYPIDRKMVALSLGFDGVIPNSMDAVSDRDFAVETVADIALMMVHLSRLCEELILWSTPEYGYIELSDRVTTGSSIMPQKKNPDIAELIRGKTGRVTGDLMSLLMVIKSLPLAYNKDMQEDKEPLFDAVDTGRQCLHSLNLMLQNVKVNGDKLAHSLTGDFSTATDLADYLAMHGLPFREAHEVVGKIVRHCIERNIGLEQLADTDLRGFSPLFAGAPTNLTSPLASANARESTGGTGRKAVLAQFELAEAILRDASVGDA
jgi:argininosuccinate lyase